MGFDFIICDSPAGIEQGALMALYFADEAIVTTNPEVSSVRDSDRILGILDSKSRRSGTAEPVKTHLLLTRYNPARVNQGEMLSVEDVEEILHISLLGVILRAKRYWTHRTKVFQWSLTKQPTQVWLTMIL